MEEAKQTDAHEVFASRRGIFSHSQKETLIRQEVELVFFMYPGPQLSRKFQQKTRKYHIDIGGLISNGPARLYTASRKGGLIGTPRPC